MKKRISKILSASFATGIMIVPIALNTSLLEQHKYTNNANPEFDGVWLDSSNLPIISEDYTEWHRGDVINSNDDSIEISYLGDSLLNPIVNIYVPEINKLYSLKITKSPFTFKEPKSSIMNQLGQDISEKFVSELTINNVIPSKDFHLLLSNTGEFITPKNGGDIDFHSAAHVYNHGTGYVNTELTPITKKLIMTQYNLSGGWQNTIINSFQPISVSLLPILMINNPPVAHSTFTTNKIVETDTDGHSFTLTPSKTQGLTLPPGSGKGLQFWSAAKEDAKFYETLLGAVLHAVLGDISIPLTTLLYAIEAAFAGHDLWGMAFGTHGDWQHKTTLTKNQIAIATLFSNMTKYSFNIDNNTKSNLKDGLKIAITGQLYADTNSWLLAPDDTNVYVDQMFAAISGDLYYTTYL